MFCFTVRLPRSVRLSEELVGRAVAVALALQSPLPVILMQAV